MKTIKTAITVKMKSLCELKEITEEIAEIQKTNPSVDITVNIEIDLPD